MTAANIEKSKPVRRAFESSMLQPDALSSPIDQPSTLDGHPLHAHTRACSSASIELVAVDADAIGGRRSLGGANQHACHTGSD